MAEIKLSPLAYLDIYRHCALFASDPSNIYGLLTGVAENDTVRIKTYIPLSHLNGVIDFELNHAIFQQIEQFNADNFDPKYTSDQILGWVRSFPTEEFQISDTERKNQFYLQTAYSEKSVAIFLPKSGDQFGMQVKYFKDPLPEIDSTSQFEDIDWNFDEIEDLDDIFKLVVNLQERKAKKAPVIEEKLE